MKVQYYFGLPKYLRFYVFYMDFMDQKFFLLFIGVGTSFFWNGMDFSKSPEKAQQK